MAPRSIWNGTIAFGLVKVPVKLYSAVEPKAIAFREVHTEDDSPLKHRRVCREENKVVERDEVAKGYEVSPDEFVLLEPEEIKAASRDRPKTIEIEEFVDLDQIDPFYFRKSYFLGMREVEAPYSLLSAALLKSGKAGIGRFTFHNREYLVAVRAGADRLILHTLRYADELIAPEDLDLPEAGKTPTKKEIGLARKLVEGLTEDFDPGEFKDEYRAAVTDLIEKKAAGMKVPKRQRRKRREETDLSSALERSLAAQGPGS